MSGLPTEEISVPVSNCEVYILWSLSFNAFTPEAIKVLEGIVVPMTGRAAMNLELVLRRKDILLISTFPS